MLNLLECLKMVDWMLSLSEHLKKMVDDERGPYSCDKASLKVSSICDNERGPLKSNLGALEFY
jgi:hypothetical protein